MFSSDGRTGLRETRGRNSAGGRRRAGRRAPLGSGGDDAGEGRRRARRAMRITLAFVIAPFPFYVLASFLGLTHAGSAASAIDQVFSVLLPAASAEDAEASRDEVVLDALFDVGSEVRPGTAAPAWFEQEVCPTADLSDVLANDDWSVVGFSSDLSPGEELSRLCALFSSRGWTGFESGVEGTATFGKDEGTCRWMMVSCVSAGDATSVVLQMQR